KILSRTINTELDRLFPAPIEILAEPGRFLVASAAAAVAKIIGKAVRGGKLGYYLDDGVYHTYSGGIFDHCQYHLKSFARGASQICSVLARPAHACARSTVPELGRARHAQPGRAAPRPGPGRIRLLRKHWRILGGK